MKRKLLATVLALVAAMTVLVISGCSCSTQSSGSASSSSASSSGQVEVPNLVWLEQKDAEKVLKEANLELGDVTEDYSDAVPEGLVISQDPKALDKVDSGTKVNIVISKGPNTPDQTTVPNLIGMSQADAEQALSDAGLVAVEDNPVVNDSVEPGLVCQQSVDAGTTVDVGTQVVIAVAINDDNVEVPNCVGQPYEGAVDALTNVGLGYDKNTAYSSDVDEGLVISQSIDGGSTVSKGTVVTLTVSLGEKPSGQVEVPNVYTYTLDDAKSAIESAGLVCRWTGDEDGTVVAMDPEPKTQVDEGTEVTIRLVTVRFK